MVKGKKAGKKQNVSTSPDHTLGKRKAQFDALAEQPLEEELVVPAQKKRKNGKKNIPEAKDVVRPSDPASEEQNQDLIQPTFRSKEKILLLTSRGISPR